MSRFIPISPVNLLRPLKSVGRTPGQSVRILVEQPKGAVLEV